MDGDSLFGVSSPSEHFSFSTGVSRNSWSPFCSSPQDYDVKNDVENNVFPDFNGLNSEQSTSVHQTPLFSDFGLVEDPFPPPDWVFSPPPDFYRDETPDQFQNSSFSETWREDDIFQPFKEKLNVDSTNKNPQFTFLTNENTGSSVSFNNNSEVTFSSNQSSDGRSLLNQKTESTSLPSKDKKFSSSNQDTRCSPLTNRNTECSFLSDHKSESTSSSPSFSNQNTKDLFTNQNVDSLFISSQSLESSSLNKTKQKTVSASSFNQRMVSPDSSNQKTEFSPNQSTNNFFLSNQIEETPLSNHRIESTFVFNQNTVESSSSTNQSDPLLEFILSRQSKFQSDANIGFQETSSDLGFVNPPEAPDADSRTDEDFRISLSASGIQTADLQTFNPLFQPQKELQADKRTDLLLKAPGIMNESRGGEKPPADGGQKFRRRPVPAPRTKALKNFQQQQLAQAELQLTAVIQNDLEVHEDVLLIGQERCVEDWPEDSPELSPQWKPAGKLRLRRDSVKISGATDGDPGADGDGKKSGKLTLGRKLKGSLLVRRSSKDKIGEELRGSETNANSLHRGSKLAADGLEEEKTEAEHKSKRSTKPKIITQRRLSKGKSVDASVKMLSSQPQDEVISKPADLLSLTENNEDAKLKQPLKPKLSAPRRLSKSVPRDPFQDSDLDLQKRRQSLEFDPPLDAERSFPQTHGRNHDTKLKKKLSVKFVPQRGYVIGLSTLDKQEEKLNLEEVNDPELEGACGFSPDPHLKTLDTPLRDRNYLEELGYLESFDLKNQRLKEDALLDTEPKRRVSLQNSSYSSGFPGSSLWDPEGTAGEKAAPGWSSDAAQDHQDCRPKKAGKFKALRFPRRHSKSIDDSEDHKAHEKPPLLLVPPVSRRDSQGTKEDEFPQKEAELFRAADVKGFDWEEYTPENKPQRNQEMGALRRLSMGKDVTEDFLNPPGATSSNYYLSDDSAAEWTWTQTNPDEEQSQETVEGDEDTDSLMEWWNTVENWSEIPSNETISTKEEETVMFKAVADHVHRGLRVYLKLFTERAERLYQHVLILFSIADDINSFHQRSKFANIAGGTTTAVGGAAAIAGLALAPVTFGASIIVSAIGLGVATAGGITAASASISDNIHNMHDRKKIEVIVLDFEAQLVEMHQCLLFISEGLSRLRLHPLLRRNHYYTGDWEVRRALQTISLVSEPLDRAEEIMSKTLTKLASLQKGFDKYFTKDSKEVKKGCKKEVTGEVRSLAKRLHEGLVELNAIREQMLDASGNI